MKHFYIIANLDKEYVRIPARYRRTRSASSPLEATGP